MTTPVGYREVLRANPGFRRLWYAEIVSFLGDWFNTIALYTAVDELGGGTEAIAAVFIAKLLPIFVMTPFAGPLIDRVDRRRLLIGTDIGRALCALGLIGAYWSRSLVLLIAVLVVMVALAGIFIPAKGAALPQVTRTEHLGAANALSAATWSVMLALGAATGGLVTALVGIELSLVVDALTFVVSAFLLLPLRRLPPDSDGPPRSIRQQGFVAGLRYLRRNPYLTAILSLKPGMALAGGGLAMLPVFATDVFRGGAGAMGVLYTGRGLGALVGALAVRRIFGDAPRTLRRLAIPAFAIIGSSYVALSFVPGLWGATAAYFGTAVGGSMIWVISGTLGQMESDNAFRGRVFSLEFGLLTLMLSATAAGSGSLVERLGWSVRHIAMASAVAMLLPLTLWSWVLTRHAAWKPHQADDER